MKFAPRFTKHTSSMHALDELKRLLSTPQSIAILPHRKPDADALGSALALSAFLKKLGHVVTVVSPTDYPEFLFWMPGHEEVLVYEGNEVKGNEVIAGATCMFCVDFSDYKRLDTLEAAVRKSEAPVILLDHHRGKEINGWYELWNIGAAATAELVYDFIMDLGRHDLIDNDVAQCIYAGIVTDTGSFKYSSTSSKIHRIAADLLDAGLNVSRIHNLIYDTNSEDRLKLLGYVLNEKLKVLYQYHTAYFTLTEEELKRFNSRTGDTEGVVNYALSIQGIYMAALFIEKKPGVKMSFRSKGTFSVADMSASYFNGGGHLNAAGGYLEKKLTDVEALFLSLLPKYQESLSLSEKH